ncbi:hypothetical protein TNCV_2754441 [Trichonephila clavipes]|nr:hypothetical protein TNCV_2754441 [Trichonephila clavipes]
MASNLVWRLMMTWKVKFQGKQNLILKIAERAVHDAVEARQTENRHEPQVSKLKLNLCFHMRQARPSKLSYTNLKTPPKSSILSGGEPALVNVSVTLSERALLWYWARTHDKASYDPIPIPIGYRGLLKVMICHLRLSLDYVAKMSELLK